MITLGFEKGNIVAGVVNTKDESDFKMCCSILKNQKFRWNPDRRQWEKSALLYNNDLYDVLKIITDVYFPDIVKQQIENYPNTLPTEYEEYAPIEKLDYTKYVKFPPIKGKHPYETFQDEDIRKALSRNRMLFNWSMGCGKSYATSVIYEYLRVERSVPKMILLTTRVGTLNLRKELCKFCNSLKLEDVAVFNSPKSFKRQAGGRKIFDSVEICEKKVLVFSYDSWKLMASAYGDKKQGRKTNIPLEMFTHGYECLLCLDECHQLSNPKSERSKSLFKYLNLFKYRYLFSATPADKPEKLYALCRILDPNLVGFMKYDDWIHKYNDVGTFFSKYAINKKKWHMDEIEKLNKRLEKFSAKREAKDVLDLPPCREKTFYIGMGEKQQALYKIVVNDIVNECIRRHPDMASTTVDVIKEAFSTVMSFTENPNVLGASSSTFVSDEVKEKCKKYNYNADYEKLDAVDAIIEDEIERDNRGILWYIHPLTKDILKEKYTNLNPIIISAEMNADERDELLEEFIRNKDHKILIASQNILATSVTITEASYAIYLETSFSYETYLQSTGRIYRIGQKKDVRIYHIYYENSVDVFHEIALGKKADLSSMLFASEKKPVFSLQEMKQMFEGQLTA